MEEFMTQAPTPAVVLVRPREEGNIGSVARAMANMGLSHLILVEPAPEIAGTARGFGVGGWEILDDCHRVPSLSQAIGPFRRVIGTASMRQRPAKQSIVLTPRELPDVLAQDPPSTPTAIVFGPEDTGLSRAELELCNPWVTIPCHPQQPTLNLAQAVLIIAYEVFLRFAGQESTTAKTLAEAAESAEPQARSDEIQSLMDRLPPLLDRIGYDQPHIQGSLLQDLRRIVNQSHPSSREVRLLWRLVNRALGALDDKKQRNTELPAASDDP